MRVETKMLKYKGISIPFGPSRKYPGKCYQLPGGNECKSPEDAIKIMCAALEQSTTMASPPPPPADFEVQAAVEDMHRRGES